MPIVPLQKSVHRLAGQTLYLGDRQDHPARELGPASNGHFFTVENPKPFVFASQGLLGILDVRQTPQLFKAGGCILTGNEVLWCFLVQSSISS